MREILFRGKRADDGEWVYGHYVHQYGADMIYLPDGVDREYGFDYYHINPETIGQYTGLTDKSGTKIFEGDIIDTPDRLIKVVWLTGNAQFDLNFIRQAHDIIIKNFKGIYMRDLKEYEVIGNIHDNPELLSGDKTV